jgi:hypothetical protein
MSMNPNSCEAVWAELVRAAKLGGRTSGWIRRHVEDTSGARVWHAIRIDSSVPALMVDVPTGACGAISELPQTRGLLVTAEWFPELPETTRAITLVLREGEFGDLFGVFCDDLLRRLGRCTGAVDAVSTIIARLERWQQFLLAGAEGLGANEVIGLTGELLVLRDHVLSGAGVNGVFFWHGPEEALRDFVLPDGTEVEVKTTSAQKLSHVRISSEHQLAADHSSLGIICLRLSSSTGHGETLVDVILAIRGILEGSPEQLARFEALLAEAGYAERHAPRYAARRFVLAEARAFRVRPGFPMLLPEAIPAGIDEVSYRLDLSSCRDFETSPRELFSHTKDATRGSTA